MQQIKKAGVTSKGKRSLIAADLKKHREIYLMAIPVLVFYLIFCYYPMYGAIIAFKHFSPARGIWGSRFVGLDNFIEFFRSVYFGRTLKNTLVISITSIIAGFPIPILFAILLNELRSERYQKVVQTITYMPHFISLVVMCGIIKNFTNETGIITQLVRPLGYTGGSMLNEARLFLPIYILSDIWQNMGWDSIIYIAAIAGVDRELYEAAKIDGAGRLRQITSVTLPGILPVIVTMFILRLGNVMNVGFEKIILLYSPATYSTADVIASYVYRIGLQDSRYDFSAAVGLFNSAINFALVFCANAILRRVNDTSLW